MDVTSASVRGVRGAITARANTPEAIGEAAKELVRRMMDENGIGPEDIASIIFSVTDDLNAAFPAEAARELGLHMVPLLCTREIDVPGSMPRCIRVLMHVNTGTPQHAVRHVYLGEARALRPDLPGTPPASPAGGETAGPRPRAATLAIDPYVPGMSAEEVRERFGLDDVVKLASNENPLGPSPAALARLQEALAGLHAYPDGGARRLTAALAARFELPEDHFIVGNGSDGVIKMLAETFLEPGDDIVCARPTFSQYAFGAALMGARTQWVPLTPDMRHDLPAMARRIGPRTKAVFVCNPNNPTGTVVTKAEFEDFLAMVPRRVLVVVDEAYAEYTDESRLFGVDAVRRGDPRVVVLRTFSKIYGLAGLRVGYGIAHPSVVAALQRVKEPFQVSAPAQLAAEAALGDLEHVRRSVAVNEEGKRYFYRRLEELGLDYIPTEANFVFFDVGRPSREVFMHLLREGVVVRAGDAFGQGTFIRATIGTGAQNQRLFDALARLLQHDTVPAGAAGATAHKKGETAR